MNSAPRDEQRSSHYSTSFLFLGEVCTQASFSSSSPAALLLASNSFLFVVAIRRMASLIFCVCVCVFALFEKERGVVLRHKSAPTQGHSVCFVAISRISTLRKENTPGRQTTMVIPSLRGSANPPMGHWGRKRTLKTEIIPDWGRPLHALWTMLVSQCVAWTKLQRRP